MATLTQLQLFINNDVFNWLFDEFSADAEQKLHIMPGNAPDSLGTFLNREQLLGGIATIRRQRTWLRTLISELTREVEAETRTQNG